MSTVSPSAQIGGGQGTKTQTHTPFKIASEAFLNELKAVYKASPNPAGLSFEQFVDTFTGLEGNIIAPPPPLDLTHPLTSYFISSSHNTYLVGHQLYGSSTAEGYINVLNRACRCIEIDVWDGEDGEPKVDHGWTLTKEMSFKDVCEAIGKYSFQSSDLPVIVSLECHADIPQQEKMVAIMREAWKGQLLEGEVPGWDVSTQGLPPPESLKNKILVKVKYLPPEMQPGGAKQNVGIQSLADETKNLSVSAAKEEEEESSEEEVTSRSGSDTEGKKKPAKVKISAALSSLGVYASAMKFAESFTDAVSTRPNHVFSFSEKKFNSLHEAQADALFQHNRHYLTRVYPFGLRFSSGNLNPQDFWRRGAQLVALNWQKVDKGMMFNEAMFAATGGLVLKPASHLPNLSSAVTLKDLEKNMELKITVLAGQNLPLPEGDDKPSGFKPYVKVTVHLSQESKHKSKISSQKGRDVAWGEKKGAMDFKHMTGVIEELSFVRFKVYDDELGVDDIAGWACVRLDRLKAGYGYLKLFDEKGRDTDGVLLVKVVKTLQP